MHATAIKLLLRCILRLVVGWIKKVWMIQTNEEPGRDGTYYTCMYVCMSVLNSMYCSGTTPVRAPNGGGAPNSSLRHCHGREPLHAL